MPTFPKSWVSIATRAVEVDDLDHIAKVCAVDVIAKCFNHKVKTSSMIFATTGRILCGLGMHITHG